MIALDDLTAALRGHLELVAAPSAASIDDIVVMESAREVLGGPGDLVLGIGLDSSKRVMAAIDRLAGRGIPALVVRAAVAGRADVAQAARSHGLALVALAANASWAHLISLLRDVLDRAVTGDARSVGDDLFALADAAARLTDAAVTIEDAQHRVLAYSSRAHSADAARVSTIVGRRVPPDVVRALRARGVFRRMTTSSDSFFLAPGTTAELGGRYVVPVRAGGEWLGSIWCAVDQPPADSVSGELRTMASAVALHLLERRVQSDLTRRAWLDRLRQAMLEPSPESRAWLPAGPWRVVALTGIPEVPPVESDADAGEVPRWIPAQGQAALDLWTVTLRRRGWAQPAVVEIAGRPMALLIDDAAATGRQGEPMTRSRRPGHWAWLVAVVVDLAEHGMSVRAAAGTVVPDVRDLPRSRREALEALDVGAIRTACPVTTTAEEFWAAITLARAANAVGAAPVHGPMAAMAGDDAAAVSDRHTLSAFLDHHGAPTRAAAALGIHVNTLRYRMDRIGALLDADLDDPEVRLALQLLLRTTKTR